MKIALLEVSHWHVPLYLSAFKRPDIEVVAISDSEGNKGSGIAANFGCRKYDSVESLLINEQPDFAFAFGRHADMPKIGKLLVERRIPFALEKPCGTNADQVMELRKLAEAAGVYVAVPLIFRLSDTLETLSEINGTLPTDITHYAIRFIVGPPSRYINAGARWMTDPAVAGGGSTINVATHFIDLFRFLTGKPVSAVSAMMSSRSHGEKVEDHSIVTMRSEDGTVGVVETGYAFPSALDIQREFTFTIGSRKAYFQGGNDQISYRLRDQLDYGTQTRKVRLDTDLYYPLFVEKVLAEVAAGAKPFAGLRDAEEMMRIMDAAYASARAGGSLELVQHSSSVNSGVMV
ncbi:Gfo/Idh/MocA family oxidoreductase [Mesorhizobium sp. M4A.F.Ca.ET.050.02.1.1]|uniref:Gfo/Idh/MocA family protein n=1 Tax=Mesorhizobium sp. M4A.F.Ca.ET.050.02.1.1 TaxID=2496754 RepID=UPI000FCC485B|nr:Gfo/Idh/MocA family oxidoreductase [Mesorhizobium sp. M4A.F.Ca.ET.050.02.1.1]RUX43337.1 Gfo/Idh/MocA family oxidoreductase [Mesorhizobium sp. M4A.F.Ca.ET.050.02.1.1]